MGKSINQQARGRGSLTFRVSPTAYVYRITYPQLGVAGKCKVVKLINSRAHTAPIAEIRIENKSFYVPAANGIYEGQEIEIGGNAETGNILKLKDIPMGKNIFNIENSPGKGGKYIRSSGCSGIIIAKDKGEVEVQIGRRRIKFHEDCRAVMGVISGDGRKTKPLVKAGKKHHIMKSLGRKWHRTSAIKTNSVDHPFGSGRGKRIKSKIAKRNAPPGAKVGHIRPRRTGRKK
jgi:large subunit ribosomal protein L2